MLKMQNADFLEDCQDDDFCCQDDDLDIICDADDTVCDIDDGLTEEEEEAYMNECFAAEKLLKEIRKLYGCFWCDEYFRPIKYQR